MSKGSHRRPSSISEKELSDNWDAAFGPRPLPNEPPVLVAHHENELADEAHPACPNPMHLMYRGGQEVPCDCRRRR